jgi:hypothetical protein
MPRAYQAFATSGCPEIADFDGSRGVPPDAIKPLVSTHLELMSLIRLLGNRGSQLIVRLAIVSVDRITSKAHLILSLDESLLLSSYNWLVWGVRRVVAATFDDTHCGWVVVALFFLAHLVT